MKNIGTKFALTLILHSFFFSVIVLGNPNEAANKTAKIRTQLMKLGVGEQAKIEIKLKNGSKLRGYIQEVKENDFTVIDEATNSSVTVPYPQVQKAKGHNLNAGTKILIVVGILILVGVLVGVEAGKS
jgi:small nuclear ribonucleoprotein (snRNP)-like protein